MDHTLSTDALLARDRAERAESIDHAKLAVWIAAVIVPWAGVIALGRFLLALLG